MPNAVDFKQAFISAFMRHQSKLHWAQDIYRTTYMQAYIYPTIAENLNMSFLYEYNKIDAIFSLEDPQNPLTDKQLAFTHYDNVSSIAVEHENKTATIETELRNFVASAYPLNILITYVGSTEARGYWVFDKPQYQDYFRALQGRLLVVIDEDMNNSWNVWKHNRGEPVKWAFFFLNASGQWETL